jgi:hypothetical protein
MKKLFPFLLIFIISGIQLFAQAPSWSWAKSAGGIMTDQGNAVTTDAAGNVYMTGNFNSSAINFGNITLSNTDTTGSSGDVFIAKYSPSGNAIWARNAEGPNFDFSNAIATDSKGNVYITGEFESSYITFGNITLTERGSGDVFIAKFDSLGNALWAKSAGGTATDYGNSIAVDISGNVYITGGFGSSIITFDTIKLNNAGVGCSANDVFIAKYDTDGNVLWAKQGGGTGSDYGRGIITDNTGNVYITGQFAGPTIGFGSDTLINFSNSRSRTLPSDIFIVKYDAGGNVLWAKGAGGNSNDYGCSIDTLNSDVFITGAFASDTIVFDTITMFKSFVAGGSNIFVAKYNSSGNALWVRQPNCAGIWGDNVGYSLDASINGKINITGVISDSLSSFGGSALYNTGITETFIAQYDASGNAQWALNVGGTKNNYGYGITSDAHGYAYLTGCFMDSTVTFGSTSLVSAGGSYNPPDIFISKLNSGTPADINEIQNDKDNTLSVFPNPSTGEFSVNAPTLSTEIKILNSLGQIIQQTKINGKSIANFTLTDSGIYFISASTANKIITKKIFIY